MKRKYFILLFCVLVFLGVVCFWLFRGSVSNSESTFFDYLMEDSDDYYVANIHFDNSLVRVQTDSIKGLVLVDNTTLYRGKNGTFQKYLFDGKNLQFLDVLSDSVEYDTLYTSVLNSVNNAILDQRVYQGEQVELEAERLSYSFGLLHEFLPSINEAFFQTCNITFLNKQIASMSCKGKNHTLTVDFENLSPNDASFTKIYQIFEEWNS